MPRVSPIFLGITTLCLISLIPAFSKLQDLKRKDAEFKLKMRQLITENNALKEEQNRLQNDPVYAEAVARQKFRVAREGEVVYRVNSVPVENGK